MRTTSCAMRSSRGSTWRRSPRWCASGCPRRQGRKHRTSHLQAVAATVPAIGELAAELKAAGVQMVSMEATSDYWRVWFAVLEEAGLAVQLVSSSQARNLPGRPKTDKEDARWIARLTEMGMLRSSFVPPPEIRALRVYTRHIWDLTADRTRYWQRLEKLLVRHEALLLSDGGERPSISLPS